MESVKVALAEGQAEELGEGVEVGHCVEVKLLSATLAVLQALGLGEVLLQALLVGEVEGV